MAKKKRKWSEVFFSIDHGNIVCSDGVVILRPEIRFDGSFDSDFSRLFSRYALDKIQHLVFDELGQFLPKSDDESHALHNEEVPGDE